MYFDIQVNGAFGVDFNDPSLTYDRFLVAINQLRAIGVRKLLPTIITGDIDEMCARIKQIVDFKNRNLDAARIISGLHIEGPFISPADGFRGTHPHEHIAAANIRDMEQLLIAGQGHIRLVTMAPEHDPEFSTLKYLTSHNIRVFAGHSDASLDCLKKAIDHGLSGFTHLGNGCPMQMPRHDNIIQRVLSLHKHLYISLIGDGIHLPSWLLESWLNYIPSNRLILTSDSISAAGMPPGEYWIGGQPILVDSDRRTTHREHQYLAGSASTLHDIAGVLSRLQVCNDSKNAWFYENASVLFG